MRSMMRFFAAVGLMVLSLPSIKAQTVILDTIGTGAAFGIDPASGVGGDITIGRFIGIDPASASPVTPKTPETAGYAVQPFVVNSLPGGTASQPLFQVQIVLNSKSPSGSGSSNLDNLYGAIFEPNTSGDPSLAAATQVGNTFRFDTSQVINGTSPGRGDNRVRLLTSSNASAAGINLEAGKTYWLAVLPKNGLNAQDVNDPLFSWGIWQSRAVGAITNPANGGSVGGSSSTTTVQALKWEQGGGRAGSVLATINGAYFATRISVGIPTATVSGTISYIGNNPGVPLNRPLILTFTPTTGSPINQTVTPDASGNFTSQPVPRANYRLRVKAANSLSEAANINLSAGNVTGVNFTLRTGDVNDDNAVDITDLLALIGAYNQVSPAAGYLPVADFNGDNTNDITDLLSLIANYNQLGNL
jgi:hypothetical protein